jgi:hypothetical protein
MKVILISNGNEIEVSPYYLYGKLVAYVTDHNVIDGIDFGKAAFTLDEVKLKDHDC